MLIATQLYFVIAFNARDKKGNLKNDYRLNCNRYKFLQIIFKIMFIIRLYSKVLYFLTTTLLNVPRNSFES